MNVDIRGTQKRSQQIKKEDILIECIREEDTHKHTSIGKTNTTNETKTTIFFQLHFPFFLLFFLLGSKLCPMQKCDHIH